MVSMKFLSLSIVLLLCLSFNIKAQTPDKKNMAEVNQSAPDFKLKDIDGKEISLASLNGKIVIVDFWATWCGPCKASFPGMQLAVNNFKNDKDVVFLFIDTRQTE